MVNILIGKKKHSKYSTPDQLFEKERQRQYNIEILMPPYAVLIRMKADAQLMFIFSVTFRKKSRN